MASKILLLVLLLSVLMTILSAGPLYPITGTTSSKSDDGSSPAISLLQAFKYFDQSYSQIYVNHNGYLTFDQPWGSYDPQQFPMYENRDIIAPFWTDLDNRGNGDIYYDQYDNGSILQQVTQDINTYFPAINFQANWIFVATWHEIAYFPMTGTQTTFQVVLTTNGQYSFVLMNYGSIASTIRSIQAGYDTINSSHHFTIPGSFSNNASGDNSVFSLDSNVNVAGCWAFRVDRGSSGCTFNGLPVQLGDSFWSDSTCAQRCTCTSEGLQCSSDPCSFSQICRPAAFQFSCQTVQRRSCIISGDPHYYTFDNKVFHFQGTCTYVLSEQCQNELPYYRVEGKNEHRGSTHVSWTRLVKVFVHNETIELVRGHHGEAKVNGIFATAPFSLRNGSIQVYQSGFSVIVSTDFGLLVSYDMSSYVRISVPYTYMNKTCGLCGNFDNHPENDFRTLEGEVVNSDVVFANSWKASADDDEPGCEPQCEGLDCAGCTAAQTALYRNSAHCGILENSTGPFAACHQHLPPGSFVDSCVYDLCAGDGSQTYLCQALNVYSSQCQQHGIQPQSWRSPGFCEISCPANSHYEAQGTGCPPICVNHNSTHNCPLPDQESCLCNSGYLLSGAVCVPQAECGCSFEGHYYNSGETVILDADCGRSCTCSSGSMSCSPYRCGQHESCRVVDGELGCYPNPHGTCSASGDPHYLTFDGKAYDFQGTCRYVLATVCNDTDGLNQFSVKAKNEAWFGLPVSITAEVFVDVLGYQVHMSRGNLGTVEVNGITRNLPILFNGSLSIFGSGSQIFVDADFGLRVKYDGRSTVSISVPPNYRGKMCGLCGNFNGNPNDEFHTPNGLRVNNADVFGTAWKVPGNYNCTEGCGSSCPQCDDDLSARSQCEVIQAADGPFSFCHAVVDPAPYFSNCVFDVCVLGSSDLLCMALETYVSACQSANVQVYPWRQNTTCRIVCQANSHYELCGTDCGNACASSIDASCGHACSEGCFCDDGFFRSGTSCVPVEKCGCQFDGLYFNAGESFWTDGCSQHCECQAPNVLICNPVSCTPAQECTIRNGQLGCYGMMSTCSVWGDPHYLTFDGALAHFQGSCSYVITESLSHSYNETQYKVVATNQHRGNNLVSFVSSVDIYLFNSPQSVHVRLGPNKRVKVNGDEVTLPTTAGGIGQVMIQGSYIVFDAVDVIVQFDGYSNLLVRMGRNYQNRVTGMCGNFNGDPTDDKILPNGTLAQNDNQFGHSWKSETSQTRCGSTDDNNEQADCPFIEEYTELCKVITNTSGPFSSCHLHSDPQLFFTSCVYDLCLYTPANGMLCSAVSAYEKTCTVLGLNIPDWRSSLNCENDPCEQLDCAEYEWCGKKEGVYGCFCDEHHHRRNNGSYDANLICAGSSGTMSLSRCQLFEAGFHSSGLHLQDDSCKGTLLDGRLVFHFDNDNNLCGTALRSNGTHFMYENTIQGNVDPHGGIISRERNLHLRYSCVYSLSNAVTMGVVIKPVESILQKKLPVGTGSYHIRMIPYEDVDFLHPFSTNRSIEMEVNEMLYMEVQTEGVDQHQFATVLDSCWATPVNQANYPVRWDLITSQCPNPEDGTVEVIQNGVSTVARFSFRMFTFTNYGQMVLHCSVHLCLLRSNNCTSHCYPGHHNRFQRDISYHDSAELSFGPLVLGAQQKTGALIQRNGFSDHLISQATLIVCLLMSRILFG